MNIPAKTTVEDIALKAIESNPEKSNYQIGRELNRLGIANPTYVTDRARNNEKFKQKLADLRDKAELKILRKFPNAGKVIDHHLKENNLDAAKLVLKHSLPGHDEHTVPYQTTVNIESLRQVIFNDMTNANGQEALDIGEPEKNNK